MSTFGPGAAAANRNCSDDDDDEFSEVHHRHHRGVFEEYAYTTFGTVTARRIVQDVQEIRDAAQSS